MVPNTALGDSYIQVADKFPKEKIRPPDCDDVALIISTVSPCLTPSLNNVVPL
jgi:hypothetical protein